MFKWVIHFVLLSGCFIAGCKKKCESTALNNLEVKMYITPNIPRIKLGDTLKLLVQIKFQNNRIDYGNEIDVRYSSVSTSGIDFTTMFRINDSVIIDGNNFKIIPIKGGYSSYNNVTVRVVYIKTNNAFEFEAYVIPIQKGLVRFANYKAEGWMNGKCVLNVFNPTIGSSENNHQLYRDFFAPGSNGFIPQNNYYVWVD